MKTNTEAQGRRRRSDWRAELEDTMRRNTGIPITNPQAEMLLELRSIVFERFVSDVEAARHFEVSASYMSSILGSAE